MKILAISEDMPICSYLQEFVEKSFNNWEFYICSNSQNIKAITKQKQINIFLVDDRMENTEVLDYLYGIKIFTNIYIIVLSKLNDLDKIKSYIENGTDNFLQIPFNNINLHTQLKAAENTINSKLNTVKMKQAYTNLKDVQNKFIETEKLAGVGNLASDIANEIYNPLSILLSNIEIIEEYVKSYEKILVLLENARNFTDENCIESCRKISKVWEKEKIDRISKLISIIIKYTKDGLSKISHTVTSLKKFSMVNQQDEKGIYDLNENIKNTLTVAKNELKYSCDVEFKAEKLPPIFINSGEINQVILNLLINAAYAIKQKFADRKGMIKIHTYTDDNYVCCSIKDNGGGMGKEILNHIFEPYFTTKPVGKGVGLSIAYDIIYIKHNGKIDVKSELKKGTEFIIKLPLKTDKDKEDCT